MLLDCCWFGQLDEISFTNSLDTGALEICPTPRISCVIALVCHSGEFVKVCDTHDLVFIKYVVEPFENDFSISTIIHDHFAEIVQVAI